MQRLKLYIIGLIVLALFSDNIYAQNKFNRGINLTDWFQKSDVTQIQF